MIRGQVQNLIPTRGMVAELALARLGEASQDPDDQARCQRRGLMDHRGRLTPLGEYVVKRQVERMQTCG